MQCAPTEVHMMHNLPTAVHIDECQFDAGVWAGLTYGVTPG